MAVNAIVKFLNAARSLVNQGMSKEAVMNFAKNEFGEINELFKKQIDNLFKPKQGIENIKLKDEVFDDTVVKLPLDDTGQPFNPKDPLKDYSKKPRDEKYTGGLVDVEPSLSDIGHGSDALMARTRLMSPGSQATTSTGLNYLLAEDNDNIRVPFADGNGVADEDAEKAALGKRVRELMDDGFDFGEAVKKAMSEGYAEGGRIGFSKGKIAKEVLDKGRRGFMKAAGAAGAGIAALKTGLLGFGKEAAPVAKEVIETVSETAKGVPPYFYQLIDVIKSKGQEIKSYGDRIKQYVAPSKDGKSELMLTEDLNTGDIQVKKIYKEGDDMVTKTEEMNFNKGRADEATKGTPADDYEEVTSYNSRIYKDDFNDPDFVDGIDVEEIVKEIDVKKASGGIARMIGE
jgi:hypothetical protein